MHLSALHIHPVKSLRALALDSVEIDALGAAGDRRFLVVDPAGGFLTQRTVPRMARVGCSLDGERLTLRCAGFGDIQVARASDPHAVLVPVRVWASDGLQAEDCGPSPAGWLSEVLATPCRLVRVGRAFRRSAGKIPGPDLVGFADAYPFLILSEGSLDDLNRRIREAGGDPVPMDRFRTNLVVAGCPPYAEDSWVRLRVGDIVFRSAGPCSRCIITATDQLTGNRGTEPLTTLAQFRRDPRDKTQVIFAQNLVHESKSGTLRVGDRVEILE